MPSPPTPEYWKRVTETTFGALERPEAERGPWLAQACAGDETLRREVESLLAADAGAGSFLLTAAIADAGAAEAIATAARASLELAAGRRIGPYRIVRELGHGGMGVVYLAARDDERFEKLVAIKVMSGDLVDPILSGRFRDEQRILASLDHPDIARLLDAGTSESGVPYVVMEYVEGEPIDAYCAAQRLSIRERLTLFGRVCDAVRYSHERLVVHRDIKARNILVTRDGSPKLLDFGIAKLLDPGGVDRHVTRTRFRALTPESASPEQVRGDPVTVSTDVYSLGVLLYRLLSGRSPYRGDMATESGAARAICEEEPLRPSATPDLPHRRELRGDLDLIALKALHKDAARRYSSVEQLSQDIQRHLGRLPIMAAPDARAYRLRKFIGRHRLGLGAAAALGLAVGAGTLATVRQAQIATRERARAEGRFDDVRHLANAFMFEVHDAIQSLPGSVPARRLLITRVLEYLEKLDRDADAESILRLEIATAYQKVGNVQGNPYFANIGDATGAMRSYRRALEITQALVDQETSAPNLASLAASHHLVADMFWADGSFPDALEHYRVAVALRDPLAAADLASETKRLDLAASYYGLGQTLLRTGDYPRAAGAYTQSQALLADVVQRNPSSLVARRSFATSAAKIGDVIAVQGDHRRALEYHAKAAATLRELVAFDPANASTKRLLAMLLYRVSNDQNQTGDFRGTLVTGREALDLQNPILESDPLNVQALADTAVTHRVLGEAYAGLNQPREALAHLSAAEKTLKRALSGNPDYADNANELAITLIARGNVLMRAGDTLPARQAYRDAMTLLDAHASRAETARYRGIVHEHVGDLERRLARSAPAAAALEHLRAACRHYEQGLEALRLPFGQVDDPRRAAEVEVVSGKLAGCSRRPGS